MTEAIPDLLAKRAALGGDCIALEDVAGGDALTYAQLNQRADKIAALLLQRGVRAGDRVAILCRNRIAFFELLFGCAKLGAILVPLNWRMPPPELDQLLTDSKPALLFYGREDAQAVAGIMYPPPIIALDGDYETMMEAAPEQQFRSHWPAPEPWYLLYTSGTTGRPKGVIYTYGMAIANYVNIGSAIGLTERDSTANFLPLFHTAGINLHSLPTLIAGGRVLVLPGFDAEALVGLFEAGRIDTFFAVPTVYRALIDHPRFVHIDATRVRHWGCGGAPLPDALAERCRDLGLRLCNGMGMTETGPTAFLMSPDDAWDHIGSVGKPQLLCSARILRDDGSEAGAGEVGDLQFAGPGVTPGYWRNEEATAAAFTADGWLRSGDLACRDGDGFYHVVGRRKDMFISGGENVYPAEVENVLCSHPSVAEAAVVAAADPHWGEVGQAFLRLAQDVAQPRHEELAEFCCARLAGYKVPARFQFLDDFPRTAAGKIQKHLLLVAR